MTRPDASRARRVATGLAALALAAAACRGGDAAPDAAIERPEPTEDWGRDILSTALDIDVSAMRATAIITLAGADSTGASFEVGDLDITAVHDAHGPLAHRVTGERLDVGVPASAEPVTFTVEYGYAVQGRFEGVMSSGLTLTWPYFCGNVFPCKSDPADGLTFTMQLRGVPDGLLAVYPESIPTDAPSYMAAWAIADLTYAELGTTAAGTEVGVWHLPDGEVAAMDGTANLVAIVAWLEDTYGDYLFGDRVGSVSAPWGPGAYGGMEHHPYWHVATIAMADQSIHAHEAAHGWFGNGVRIACWEDFVLSEGTVSYLTARALLATAGAELADATWASYQTRLDRVASRVAWPDGCNDIDILADGLFSDAPYMKGAFFFRALEGRLGVEVLDAALASFYDDHGGRAARMQDLLDHIAAQTTYDPTPCALAWLRSDTLPAEPDCP